MPVPLIDVRAQLAPLLDEVEARIAEVLAGGQFILGPNVRAFEDEAAAHVGASHGVGVANGTDALVLALDALGIGAGDDVICPSFTFYATAEAIARVGATPVFCDIDPVTLNLDPVDVAARVTPRTRAIVAVHLFGRPAAIGQLPDGIPVIEDAAQAFGARDASGSPVGSVGRVATFSFFPTKNLFCLGDGGLITTDDAELTDRIRRLRFHGSRDKETFELVGYNSRLDEIQAAVLRVSLGQIDAWNASRREAAARYGELGLGAVCELPEPQPGHVYHVFGVRSAQRERLSAALAAREIASKTYYSTPLHLQPVFAHLGYRPGSLPETERAAREIVALPMWAGMPASVQEQVVEAACASLVESR